MKGKLKACPECGNIRQSDYRQDDCERCKGQGHLYRLLDEDELKFSIDLNERFGYHQVAIKRALIRDALVFSILDALSIGG